MAWFRKSFPRAPYVVTHFVDVRPVGRAVLGGLARGRIDPRFEQAIEVGLERRGVEGPACNLVPVEGIQVAEVEDQAMPIRDRPLVERVFRDEFEQRVGVLARLLQFTAQVRVLHVGICSGNDAFGASWGIT